MNTLLAFLDSPQGPKVFLKQEYRPARNESMSVGGHDVDLDQTIDVGDIRLNERAGRPNVRRGMFLRPFYGI